MSCQPPCSSEVFQAQTELKNTLQSSQKMKASKLNLVGRRTRSRYNPTIVSIRFSFKIIFEAREIKCEQITSFSSLVFERGRKRYRSLSFEFPFICEKASRVKGILLLPVLASYLYLSSRGYHTVDKISLACFFRSRDIQSNTMSDESTTKTKQALAAPVIPDTSWLLKKDPDTGLGPAGFYGRCMAGGLLACGVTHTAVVTLDVAKCRSQTHGTSGTFCF